ncbi:hypothetical protein L207DRAFT_574329 [Hyaloscypha variabilis F]|uniref:Uncharacterized protein n=1 Tax=Hyaloscypha variabilis (strain UAMH 11265 / GT02V1 / F) TaxID=1149755 RepID=A0A2J6QSW0_HYAVF|nr:hypothetical protein L207DRAFT_574329 [Hyaloscypha variabilis F]
MTAMEWMPSYNANAAQYETPQVVKIAFVPLQSKEIARMFVRDNFISVSPTTAATQTTSTSIPNNGNCNSDTKATVESCSGGQLSGFTNCWVDRFFMWKQLKYKRAKASDKITPPATSSNNALARMSNLQQNPRGDPQLTDPTVLQSLTPTTGSYLGAGDATVGSSSQKAQGNQLLDIEDRKP